MAQLERNFAKQVDAYLKSLPECYSVNYTGAGQAGVPDRLICYKGSYIGLELKSDTGKATRLQLLNIDRINAAGGKAAVVRTMDDVKKIIHSLEIERDYSKNIRLRGSS